MSGLLEEVGTPCPSRLDSSRLERSRGGSDSFTSMWEDRLSNCDDTMNVDFTTQIKAPVLTGAKPRRRTKTSTFAIHDDGPERTTSTAIKSKRPPSAVAVAASNRKSSLLAQPAQRFRPKVSFAPSPTSRHERQQGSPKRKRQSSNIDSHENKELLMRINASATESQQPKDVLKKDVRRNTVYIPPDDTTVASVFMGMFSPLKSNARDYTVNDDTQVNTLESQIVKKRQAKKSLGPSAHRVPLQPSSKFTQESSIHVDMVGKNGGKENIPPGSLLVSSKGKNLQPTKPLSDNIKLAPKSSVPPARTSAPKPLSVKNTNGSLQRAMLQTRDNAKARSLHQGRERERMSTREIHPVDHAASSMQKSNMTSSLRQSKSETVLSRSTISRSSTKALNEYPLISENITNPAMYDDNWLSHQEVVITQLLNDLFHQADTNFSHDDPTLLRHGLLSIYQDPSITHLYKRIQASLLYGAMSIPKDVLSRSKRLTLDVGMKRKFLDFWVETYDLRALRAAVETITGRRIPEDGTNMDKSLKRKLENFLDIFLLHNQDIDLSPTGFDDGETDAAARAYRRTVLRSMMVIILLDKGRMHEEMGVPHLFIPSSQFKSSAAVVKGLARFLLPSCGDILKALSHLDCHLSYEQQPLQEYEYTVNNLAVDMRDGVRLTRIVELLLYPSITGSVSELPLSRRLKLPCLGRAVKLYNVQIALEALRSTPSSRKLADIVLPEDIVNGHREKTIALLWGLVSKWGLSGLVDWDDVRKEIERLKLKAIGQFGYEQVKDQQWFHRPSACNTMIDAGDESMALLKQWASILAHFKGLHLENLTTSFADGKLYESIVDEYEPYILGQDHDAPASENKHRISTLQYRLQALGCSEQFATLVTPSSYKSRILDSDFTVGALAFLCSRLLAATKRVRAATVLQRRWRRILAGRDEKRRAMARDVAMQCAAVVQTRDQILWAKGVIVQWWRVMKAKRERRKSRVGGRPYYGKRIVARRTNPSLRGQTLRH